MVGVPASKDTDIRLKAFEFLGQQRQVHGDLLPLSVLREGFDYQGTRVPLMAPKGIHKPRLMDVPLSITTVPPTEQHNRPYDDQIQGGGLLLYRYRGSDPQHPDNVGLRRAMQGKVPLIYLYGIVPGRYYPIWPVYIVGDNPRSLTFTVAVEDAGFLEVHGEIGDVDSEARRRYVTRLTRQRLHQGAFREQVLLAYSHRCAICHLEHDELLDAAHILPDTRPQGLPVVPNGLALCKKLHNAAFDGNFIGIRPDLVVELREDIRREGDGPMLLHGIQAFDSKQIWVPRRDELKPDGVRLKERYEAFLASA